MYGHSRLLQAIVRNAERAPEKIVLIADAVRISNLQLLQNIRNAAAKLLSVGVKTGDRVILSAQKDVDFVFFYFASHLIGSVNVIVDATSAPDRLRLIERLAKPRFCLGYESPTVKSLTFAELNALVDVGSNMEEPSSLSEEDDAEILFTSGTTGVPKGVRLSHRNIFSSAENINSFIGNGSDDIEVLGLPICHSFGLGRLRCNILKGATLVLLGNFANVRQFFKAIEDNSATGFGMVPAVWAYIKKMSGLRISKYADQIKYIEIGSAAMSLAAKRELCELFPKTRICHHYGLTEASRAVFMEYHEDYGKLDAIGREVCNKVEVRILEEDGKECAPGSVGEICIRGNMVTKGYLSDADNQASFVNGYFRTGDEGRREADGLLYLVGRRKEMINVGGKKVNPIDVENAIIGLGVVDCAAVGMPDPDGILGEVVKVCVQKGGTTLTFDEIRVRLAGKLLPHEMPARYEWVDEIPKTASGKKQRLKLVK